MTAALAAATLDTHTVVLDGGGQIIPWTLNPSDGYDRVMFLSWNLLLSRTPTDPANGLPVPYTHSEYDPNTLAGSGWPNNPAGKNAMLADSAIMYYPYSGNHAVIDLVRGLLDHQLQHGTTPANYAWPNVPWSTAAAGSITYGNDTSREGAGVVEPDKVGELGFHGYLRFYELTGDTDYLLAAIACADALAQHVRNGDATHSPWPFRVLAQTGATARQEEYCSDVVGPIRLFDELLRLGLGNTSAYQTARQTAWNWLMTYPMSNRVWANYFEDVPPRPNDLSNINQYCPGETARYLLEHPEMDANWFAHVTNLLGYIETTFGGTDSGAPGLQYGARVISEQVLYQFKMASHTSRFASDYALLYSLTGDPAARDIAYRSLNWCTYMCRTNDVVIEGPEEFALNPGCWFTDGHGDYIRHFMLALGAVPEWAPAGQNHITGSTTVIRSAAYSADGNSIAYTTFDDSSEETLRVAFTPASVVVDGTALTQRSDLNQPGWVFTPSNGVLRIRHDIGTSVQILAGSQPPTITSVSLPIGVVNVAYSATLTASGGIPPYVWSIASGSLPPGLGLDSGGAITGVPTATGAFNFTARVSDASAPAQTTASPLSITVAETLISISVTPMNPIIPTGNSQLFSASGNYSDGSTQDITSQAVWTSSSPAVAAIRASGLATAAMAGTTVISATLGGVSGNSTLTVEPTPVATTTIWPSTAMPGSVDGGPDSAVELGVKFRSDVAGNITGVRFYKASANTGAHLGKLWSSTGTLLASATFSNESASGWQQVSFATPVAITANTVYVASYHANNGHYSADANYFLSKGADNPPLHALANGVSGGDGVYAYGASSAFPSQTWNSANYWVDVVLQSGPPPTLRSIAVTPANPTILTRAMQQFTATGSYTDGSAQNITSQAAWVSSNTAAATVNGAGLAAGVSAGGTTISAALAGVTGQTTLTVQAAPLAIATASLPGGVLNAAYSTTLNASGGTAPYAWSISGGTLPTGLSLNAASGAISGTPTVIGSFSFTAQVRDTWNPAQTVSKALSIGIASSVVTIWPSTTVPGLADSGPDSAVEIGVKFRSDVAGTITGIRFYKTAANTGTHVGNLWTSAGTRLATATFTGESASGWQQASFATPLAITANTVYVASYHANNGHYSADANYFLSKGADNPPLHALANGVSGGNGVYTYGTSSAFPSQTWYAANYWVDVIFAPSNP